MTYYRMKLWRNYEYGKAPRRQSGLSSVLNDRSSSHNFANYTIFILDQELFVQFILYLTTLEK